MHYRQLLERRAQSACPLSFHHQYLLYLKNPSAISEANRTANRIGFHKPVAEFRYDGGHLSQRAYFDTMKDYMYLSKVDKGLGLLFDLLFLILM